MQTLAIFTRSIRHNNKNKETMTTQEQIQNELGQEIKNIKEHDGFLIFDCEDGIRRSNKLTKTGKHKKGSVRVW